MFYSIGSYDAARKKLPRAEVMTDFNTSESEHNTGTRSKRRKKAYVPYTPNQSSCSSEEENEEEEDNHGEINQGTESSESVESPTVRQYLTDPPAVPSGLEFTPGRKTSV